MKRLKWAGRIMGCALVLTAFLFLITGGGADGAQPASGGALLKRGEVAGKPMLVLRDDVLRVLVANLSASGGSGELEPSMIFLLTIDGQGEISLLNLPALTRIRIQGVGEGGLYWSTHDTLASAYRRTQAEGRGIQSLLEAAEQILGGVPVERCVVLSDPGLEALVDALGGVYVVDDYFSMQVGGYRDQEAARESGDYVLLTGAQALAYAASSIGDAAVDIGALSRQNTILVSILRRIVQQEVELGSIEALCGGWFYANLSSREAGALALALEDSGASKAWTGRIEDLWGTDRMIERQGYRLIDRARVKEYVLETFYRMAE